MRLMLFLSCLLFMACSSKKEVTIQETVSAQEVEELPPPEGGEMIKVKATVLSIDPILEGYAEDNPCSKTPCSGKIRIDQILMVNRFFDDSFANKDEVKAFFLFTMNETTEDLFPVLDNRMPGLQVGNQFEGVVKVGGQLPDASLTVETYTVLK